MSNKTNILFLKARYLNADLEECNERFFKYYNDFFKKVNAIINKDHVDDVSDNDSAPIYSLKANNEHHDFDEVDNKDTLEKEEFNFLNDKLKKVYKKIVQVCHPDKHAAYLSKEDRDSLINIYNDCTGAAKDGDLYVFLECASRLYIEIPDLDEEELSMLRKNCSKIEDELKKIKNTYPWIWGEESDEKQKENILNLYIKKISG